MEAPKIPSCERKKVKKNIYFLCLFVLYVLLYILKCFHWVYFTVCAFSLHNFQVNRNALDVRVPAGSLASELSFIKTTNEPLLLLIVVTLYVLQSNIRVRENDSLIPHLIIFSFV